MGTEYENKLLVIYWMKKPFPVILQFEYSVIKNHIEMVNFKISRFITRERGKLI